MSAATHPYDFTMKYRKPLAEVSAFDSDIAAVDSTTSTLRVALSECSRRETIGRSREVTAQTVEMPFSATSSYEFCNRDDIEMGNLFAGGGR